MNLHPQTKEAYELLHKGTLALARAEQQGIRVDLDYVDAKKKHLARQIARLEAKFMETTLYKHWAHTTKKVNMYSSDQLEKFLYGVKKLQPVKMTASSTDDDRRGSTSDEALKELGLVDLEPLLEARKLNKIASTYLASFEREQVDGYIHPVFNLHLVKTYRSSSDHPNFQNIPIRDEVAKQICRGALFPRPGHQLLELDYSGMEVRANACYNKDKELLRYLHDPTTNMHTDQARELFFLTGKEHFSKDAGKLLRQAAKNGFVFAEFYGDYYKNCAPIVACKWGQLPKQGKWKRGQGVELGEFEPIYLADHLIDKGIMDLNDFAEHLRTCEKKLWEKFHSYAEWKNKWFAEYESKGYFDLLTGFRCGGLMVKNNVINYPGQGTGFHCLLWSLINVDEVMYREKWDTRLIGQIHDSMVFDVNPGELNHVVKVIHKITTESLRNHWKWINCPMEVDMEIAPIDRPWSEKKELKFN